MKVLKGRVVDENGGPPIEKGAVAIDGRRISLWAMYVPFRLNFQMHRNMK